MFPKEYFENYYNQDLKTYADIGSNCLCQRGVTTYFKQDKIKLHDEKNFFICQFELNLLNQIFHVYFSKYHEALLKYIPSFIDCRCSYSQYPWEVFKWVKISGEGIKHPITFSKQDILIWDIFFKEYISDILKFDEFKGITIEEVFEAIKNDSDCRSALEYLLNSFN